MQCIVRMPSKKKRTFVSINQNLNFGRKFLNSGDAADGEDDLPEGIRTDSTDPNRLHCVTCDITLEQKNLKSHVDSQTHSIKCVYRGLQKNKYAF